MILKGSSEYNYEDFTALRNEVQRDIKKAKASFFQSKLEDSMGNPRKLWEHLKLLGYRNKSKNTGKIVLDINGSLCYDTLSCNHMNYFFHKYRLHVGKQTALSTQDLWHRFGDFQAILFGQRCDS